MRRVTEHDLNFYDRVADRINRTLGDPACSITQSRLASEIGWHRASLCNFLNRIDKTIAAHFIPKIAQAFRVSIEDLMCVRQAAAVEKSSWDPRIDDSDILIDKVLEWRRCNLPTIRLHSHLPPYLLPRRAMVANYIATLVGGDFPEAAERLHDVIHSRARTLAKDGEGDVVNLIFTADLLRLCERDGPFDRFSIDEIAYVLETLKTEWVRHQGYVLIAVSERARTSELKLELSSSTCFGVVGRQTRFDFGRDLRVRWSDDADVAGRTHDCLIRLKQSTGIGARERPTVKQIERMIDGLLQRIDRHSHSRPSIPTALRQCA